MQWWAQKSSIWCMCVTVCINIHGYLARKSSVFLFPVCMWLQKCDFVFCTSPEPSEVYTHGTTSRCLGRKSGHYGNGSCECDLVAFRFGQSSRSGRSRKRDFAEDVGRVFWWNHMSPGLWLSRQHFTRLLASIGSLSFSKSLFSILQPCMFFPRQQSSLGLATLQTGCVSVIW